MSGTRYEGHTHGGEHTILAGEPNGRIRFLTFPHGLEEGLPHLACTKVSWGYVGRGSAKAALIILAHAAESEVAASVWHAEFMLAFTARLDPNKNFIVHQHQILEWLEHQRRATPGEISDFPDMQALQLESMENDYHVQF